MNDFATSSDGHVQAQLDRLFAAGPGTDTLGLERITLLLDRLGNPHRALPPVFHVAGTNGKGSTCAFLRAMLEAAGHRVHVYTSPHLVRFNERIRLGGELIGDAALARLLAEVNDVATGTRASFFEVTTAAAYLAFSRAPADACVIEVGLGGRLDATNVLDAPLVCGIAQLGLDHQAFLGDTIEDIAAEKAGIAKRDVPLVTMAYPDRVAAVIARAADERGAVLVRQGEAWSAAMQGGRLAFADRHGPLDLPLPLLPGDHQRANAGLAIAMLRAQSVLAVPGDAITAGLLSAHWPARMQRLGDGPLTRRAPRGSTVWLDGGHNPQAGEALGRMIERPVDVICGMLANKDAAGFLQPIASRIASFHAVPIAGHAHHDPALLCALVRERFGVAAAHPAAGIADAMAAITAMTAKRTAAVADILVCGSLYLAGDALGLNDELPG